MRKFKPQASTVVSPESCKKPRRQRRRIPVWTPIDDFVKSADSVFGFGCYMSRLVAVHFAQQTTELQKKQWWKWGYIPETYYRFLMHLRIIEENLQLPPKKRRTVDHLIDTLWHTGYVNKRTWVEGEWTLYQILKHRCPMLSKSLGSIRHKTEKPV